MFSTWPSSPCARITRAQYPYRPSAECFELGVFYLDDHRYLEMDDGQFAAVAARINPDVAWWHAEL